MGNICSSRASSRFCSIEHALRAEGARGAGLKVIHREVFHGTVWASVGMEIRFTRLLPAEIGGGLEYDPKRGYAKGSSAAVSKIRRRSVAIKGPRKLGAAWPFPAKAYLSPSGTRTHARSPLPVMRLTAAPPWGVARAVEPRPSGGRCSSCRRASAGAAAPVCTRR